MSKEEEVLKYGKRLERMVSNKEADHASAVDMLNRLKDMKMSLDVLQKTKIGMTVNNFRKACTNEEATSLAKTLIKAWKKLLPDNNTSSKSSNNASNEPTNKNKDSPDSSHSSSARSTPTVDGPTQSRFPSKATDTTDSVRLKCREMLATAMQGDGDMPDGCHDPEVLSAEIEEFIFTEFNHTNNKYRNRVRSRVANLRDKRNPALRLNVLTRAIMPERIAKMTAEEMASDEMKNLRTKFTKDGIDNHQLSTTGGTVTDLLKCGRCGKRSVTYNQVQTRSADEPMTTFCFCNDCGNRWKFC